MKNINIDTSFLKNAIMNLYLLFLGIALPLHSPNGYYMLGYDKFLLWRTVSLWDLFLTTVCCLVSFLISGRAQRPDLLHALIHPTAYKVSVRTAAAANNNHSDTSDGVFFCHKKTAGVFIALCRDSFLYQLRTNVTQSPFRSANQRSSSIRYQV